jgi:plasmid stabilization system protein ParE
MGEFHINITGSAFDDLWSIAVYIKETLKMPMTADNQIARITEAILSLDKSPLRYPLVHDSLLAAQGYRVMPVDNYLVFYVVSETNRTVDVSRLIHSRRNWVSLL